MIKLQDLSDLMQKTIAIGITFMVSKSGLPGNYSINAAYYSKRNKSVHLSFLEKDGVIVRCADLEHPAMEFADVDSVASYLRKELDVND